jgi:hypothetical protein
VSTHKGVQRRVDLPETLVDVTGLVDLLIA